VLVHLEHAHAVFAEHGTELVIASDLTLFVRDLDVVALE